MTAVDVVIIGALIAAVVAGAKGGGLAWALRLVGLLGGVSLALWLVPRILGAPSGSSAAFLVVLIVMGGGVFGAALGDGIGRRLRDRLTSRGPRAVDGVIGAVLAPVTVAVLAWALGAVLVASPWTSVSREASGSVLLDAMDQRMPTGVRTLVADAQRQLESSVLSDAVGVLRPEIASVGPLEPTDRPDAGVLDSPGVDAAAASVVRVLGTTNGCGGVTGSGVVIAPERVLTNAHVVAGIDRPTVAVGRGVRRYQATVVAFDPSDDVAVLEVPGLDRPALSVAPVADKGDDAVVAGFPRGGPYTLEPARVLHAGPLRLRNGDDRQPTVLDVYTVAGRVVPGNSGGPLLSADGRMLGLVFASSTDEADTGFALMPEQFMDTVKLGVASDTPVDTGACHR
jgi:S1-C subfamily serine protease